MASRLFGPPTVDALAALVIVYGIAPGLAFGAPTVDVSPELIVASGIASGRPPGSPSIESLTATPSIRTQRIQGRAAADPHHVTTSGFDGVSGDLVPAFTGISGTTLSSLAGTTDDSYAQPGRPRIFPL
jgi:hypothetical protein